MVAALHDGHGNAYPTNAAGESRCTLPLLWAWVQGRLVITHVSKDAPVEAASLKPGTVVLAIDGVPAAAALAQAERSISGATEQWRRYRALGALGSGPELREVALEVEDAQGQFRVVKLRRLPPVARLAEPRPPKIHEIKPGIIYIDIDRVDGGDFREALPRLEKAEGIVLDFRGYPGRISFDSFFPHLIDHPVTSPQWHIPFFTRPDQTDMVFRRAGEWRIAPKAPYLKARRAFIIDGRAISYAESCLGIVEHEKLGALVGSPTAGTNGNVNPISLPGGFNVVWTGMKVLKHDGSRHHGIGIQPPSPSRGRLRASPRARRAARNGCRGRRTWSARRSRRAAAKVRHPPRILFAQNAGPSLHKRSRKLFAVPGRPIPSAPFRIHTTRSSVAASLRHSVTASMATDENPVVELQLARPVSIAAPGENSGRGRTRRRADGSRV